MTATYPQVGVLPSELIRVPALGAVAGERPRPGLTFQSTGPTLQFDSAEAVLRTLRERGLRISTARRVIVNYLFDAGHGAGRYVLVGGGEHEYLACDRCGAIKEIDRSELDSLRGQVHQRFGY